MARRSPTCNASSLHCVSPARRAVEDHGGRCRAVGPPSEVVLTTGGTKATTGCQGPVLCPRSADPRRHLLVPAIEHPRLDSAAGCRARKCPGRVPSGRGRPFSRDLAGALHRHPEQVALGSVMWPTRVGTVNPMRELAEVAHSFGCPAFRGGAAVGICRSFRRIRWICARAHRAQLEVRTVRALLLWRSVELTPAALRRPGADVPPAAGHPSGRSATASAVVADARGARLARGPARRPIGKVLATCPAPSSWRPWHGVIDGGPSRLRATHTCVPRCEGDSL